MKTIILLFLFTASVISTNAQNKLSGALGPFSATGYNRYTNLNWEISYKFEKREDGIYLGFYNPKVTVAPHSSYATPENTYSKSELGLSTWLETDQSPASLNVQVNCIHPDGKIEKEGFAISSSSDGTSSSWICSSSINGQELDLSAFKLRIVSAHYNPQPVKELDDIINQKRAQHQEHPPAATTSAQPSAARGSLSSNSSGNGLLANSDPANSPGTTKPEVGQNSNAQFDAMVNEQFSTLLESLLRNGKIDQNNAITYLETVFGYDKEVKEYLQNVDMVKQINFKAYDKLSLNDKVASLNSVLLSIMPETYRRDLLQNTSYLGWQIGREMDNGGITTETLQNTINLFSEEMKQNQENALIIEKLKQLTPKIENLRTSATTSSQRVVNDSHHTDNWKLNPVKIKKGFTSATYNKVTIESGSVIFDPAAYPETTDRFSHTYKNSEKFDFSKDFRISIKGKLDPYKFKKREYQATTFSVLIGEYYKFECNLVYYNKNDKDGEHSYCSVKMPDAFFTTEYGVFNFEEIYYLSKDENVRTVASLITKKLKRANPIENKDLNFSNGFDLVILSQNGYLSYYINGIETGIKKRITYMPNKFSFDIKADFIRKTIIESVTLEHL
jgi:hypothetical protein